jgi:poly(A) polymerase
MVREIWGLQPRLVNRRGRGGASRLLTNPRFRAAYDFLLLRAESGEDVAEHAQWWTRFQEVDDNERRSMLEDKRGPKRRRRRRRGRGASRPEATGQPAV